MADAADSARPRRDAGNTKPAPVAAKPRQLPHNPDLEKVVLGTILAGGFATAMQVVREAAPHPLVFFGRDQQILYLACLTLDDQNVRPEAGEVAELLGRWPFGQLMENLRQAQLLQDDDRLDGRDRARLRELLRRDGEAADLADSALVAVGGSAAIYDLAGQASITGLKRNAELLRDYHQKRRLIRKLTTLADRAYLTTDSFGALADEANSAVLDLTRNAGVASVHSVQQVVDDTLAAIAERNANPEDALNTGIAEVDKKLIAFRPGGLYILAARPGVGKTSLALKIVEHACNRMETRGTALFFSLEVDRIDLMKKMLAAMSGVEFSRIDRGELADGAFEKVELAAKRFQEWRFDLMDVSDLTVHGLRAVVRRRILELAHEAPLRLVVIDYLGLLSASRADMSEYERVSEVTRVLKVLAKDLKIPVLALSQMSRDSEKGAGSASREPRLSDLRGSGSIEQDADAVLFIHRIQTAGDESADERGDPRIIELILAKNRFGPTGKARLEFLPKLLRFQPHLAVDPGDGHNREDRRQRSNATPNEVEDVFA